VPVFVEALRSALVPGCDPGVVGAVLGCASTQCGGQRGRDGRRASALTPGGVPFEASVTGRAGRSAAALRYVTEPGAGLPFFGPRLAVQRRVVADLVARAAREVRASGDALKAVHDVLFPDPGAVPARTRFASFVGVVHTPEHPSHLAGLKVYANLRAADPAAAVARLGRRWPGFDDLDGLTRDLVPEGGPPTAQFAALEAGAGDGLRSKLYLRTRTAGPRGLAGVARRVGADPAALDAALADAGLGLDGWVRPVFACLSTRAEGGGAVALSVHVAARSADLDAAAMADVARRITGRHGDAGGFAALTRAMAAASPGAAFEVTVVGVGLAAGGGVGKVNVYAAPAPEPRRHPVAAATTARGPAAAHRTTRTP
jgi:hypothetical protein